MAPQMLTVEREDKAHITKTLFLGHCLKTAIDETELLGSVRGGLLSSGHLPVHIPDFVGPNFLVGPVFVGDVAPIDHS